MKDFKPFIISLSVILLLWISAFFALPYFVPLLSERGILGDSFGILNALFSGMAFAGIIATILMQRDEIKLQREDLKLQREELKLTREELTKSAVAQDASQKALNLQLDLMTKQAVLNAYQATYLGNIELLKSGISPTNAHGARQTAKDELAGLKKKIENSIQELEIIDAKKEK